MTTRPGTKKRIYSGEPRSFDSRIVDGLWEAPEEVWLEEVDAPPANLDEVEMTILLGERLGSEMDVELLPGGDPTRGRSPTGLGLPAAWLRRWRDEDASAYRTFATRGIGWKEPPLLELQQRIRVVGGQALPGWDEQWTREERARRVGAVDARRVLDDFLALASADPEEILAFSARYGTLEICRTHGVPVTYCHRHRQPARGSCYPYRPEPLLYWRYYAVHARAVVRVANELGGSRISLSETDWALLCGEDLATFRRRREASERHGWRARWERETLVAREVQRWLDLGNVRPRFVWREGTLPAVEGVGEGLFGGIANHLAYAVLGGIGRAECVECGSIETPVIKPRSGQRFFCVECQRRGVPQKWAQRAYRQRIRRLKEIVEELQPSETDLGDNAFWERIRARWAELGEEDRSAEQLQRWWGS